MRRSPPKWTITAHGTKPTRLDGVEPLPVDAPEPEPQSGGAMDFDSFLDASPAS